VSLEPCYDGRMSRPLPSEQGPFRADQIRSGDPYELSNGHAIHCMTTSARGSRANLVGGSVLDSDPAVEEAGVDTGYSPEAGTLRAPDVAVGNVPDEPGWVEGVPPLAVEYADTGQDENELQAKIAELLSAGTKLVWVVRLAGPRRVEVHESGQLHESGQPMRVVWPGEEMTAPGILRNPIPVEALYDRRAAHEVIFRNHLQRHGYQDLEEVRTEGQQAGQADFLLRLLEAKQHAPLPADVRERVRSAGTEQLLAWGEKVLSAESLDDVFG